MGEDSLVGKRNLLRVGDKIAAKSRNKSEKAELVVTWRLAALEDSFHFYVQEKIDLSTYLEYDLLEASGKAYEDKKPWSFKRVLDYLEEMSPGYLSIILNEKITLWRKRAGKIDSGVLVTINGKEKSFKSDANLLTINFFDYYNDILKSSEEVLTIHNLEGEDYEREVKIIN